MAERGKLHASCWSHPGRKNGVPKFWCKMWDLKGLHGVAAEAPVSNRYWGLDRPAPCLAVSGWTVGTEQPPLGRALRVQFFLGGQIRRRQSRGGPRTRSGAPKRVPPLQRDKSEHVLWNHSYPYCLQQRDTSVLSLLLKHWLQSTR